MRKFDEEAFEKAKLEFAAAEDDTPRVVQRMYEIQRGVKKEDSKYIADAEESESWDNLVVEIAEIEAKGGVAISGEEPYWREDD